jgi:hypothetical protein
MPYHDLILFGGFKLNTHSQLHVIPFLPEMRHQPSLCIIHA